MSARETVARRGTASPGSRVLLIPAFNEARHLGELLLGAASASPGYRLVVVDDGSADATARIAAEAGALVLRHPGNLGYGAALQTGYKFALRSGAALVVQMDGDGQHDPAEIPRLVEPIERDELDLVIGSRFLEASGYAMGLLQSAGRRLFEGIGRLMGVRVTDPTSGYQAMNRRVLALYASDAFPTDFPDVDVLLMAHRHGLRIGERPATMRPGLRPSSLHSGLAPLYYVYKMMLAVWAASVRVDPPPSEESSRWNVP